MATVVENQTVVVQEHMALVQHIVNRVAAQFPRHIDRDDIVQAGMLGLVEASQRFEASTGVPFSSFAGVRIEGAILDLIRSDNWMPRRLRTAQRTIKGIEDDLRQRGTPVTDALIATEMGISTTEVTRLRARILRGAVSSLDGSARDDSYEKPMEQLSEELVLNGEQIEGGVVEAEEEGFLRAAIGLLPEKQQRVVTAYFFEEKTLQMIAEELEVSVSRVSRLKASALEKLKLGVEGQYEPAVEQVDGSSRRSRAVASYVASVSAAADLAGMRKVLS